MQPTAHLAQEGNGARCSPLQTGVLPLRGPLDWLPLQPSLRSTGLPSLSGQTLGAISMWLGAHLPSVMLQQLGKGVWSPNLLPSSPLLKPGFSLRCRHAVFSGPFAVAECCDSRPSEPGATSQQSGGFGFGPRDWRQVAMVGAAWLAPSSAGSAVLGHMGKGVGLSPFLPEVAPHLHVTVTSSV